MAFSIANPIGLWPGGIVPYEIRDFTGYDRAAIRRAIRHWILYSIVRMVPHKEETDFLVFGRRDDICQATVGRVGGEQWIRCDVGDGFDTGSIIHEIGHAVGLQHEHQRPDRDSFVATDLGDQDVWPRVAVASDRSFVVVWEDRMREVMARGFHADGSERFPAMIVPCDQRGKKLLADVAITNTGEVIIVWTDDRNKNYMGQIRARILDLDGQELQPDFTVNTRGGGDQRRPRIAANQSGHYFVVWEDDEDNNNKYQIHLEARDTAHQPLSGTVTLNRIWRGQQIRACIATP